jgi:hypothetical protein
MDMSGQIRQRRPLGPALLEIIAHAESHPDTDEILLVEQLRSVFGAIETPVDRLFACYPSLVARAGVGPDREVRSGGLRAREVARRGSSAPIPPRVAP